MKNKIATAFEQIVTKSKIDVVMAKVNTTLIAAAQSNTLDYFIERLEQYIDESLHFIPSTDEETMSSDGDNWRRILTEIRDKSKDCCDEQED